MTGNDNSPWLPVRRRPLLEQHRKKTPRDILPSSLVSLALANTCPLMEALYPEKATPSARMRKDAARRDRCDAAYRRLTDVRDRLRYEFKALSGRSRRFHECLMLRG